MRHNDDPTTVATGPAQFERLYEQGQRWASTGNLAQAAEAFGSALQLWHGEAFKGLGEIPALHGEGARWEQLHRAALTERIGADHALGSSASLIPELYALVQQDPVFERRWGQLMTALYMARRPPGGPPSFCPGPALLCGALRGRTQ